MKYKIEELREKSIFGYEEILLEIPRQTTIRTISETDIFYLNKDDFLDLLKGEDLITLKQKIIPMDVENIAKNILTIKTLSKLKVTLFL